MGKKLNHFKKIWIEDVVKSLKLLHPDISNDRLEEFAKRQYEKNVKNTECDIHNNYINRTFSSTLLELIDWIETNKPVCAGYGTFYLNQDKADNPDANMVLNFMDTRARIKKTLKVLNPQSYEYMQADMGQNSEKRKANSYYGVQLSPVSAFYNRYTGVSITATGQSLISTTATGFEAYLAGNFKLYSSSDLFNYVNTCLEDMNIDKYQLEDVPSMKLYQWLSSKLKYDTDKDILTKLISNLSQKEINRVYYVNNMFEVIRQDYPIMLLTKLFRTITNYRDAAKVPEEAKEDIELLWDFIKDTIFYKGFFFDRIYRFKNDTRKAVILCDTDSDMLCIARWVEFMRNNIYTKAMKPNDDNTDFIAISIQAYLITSMIEETLSNYTDRSNVLPRFKKRINMKNELLMSRMALASTKKRYIAMQKLREGVEFTPPRYDAKGIDFLKSTTREATRQYLDKICQDYILNAEEVDVSKILNKLDEFKDIIRASLSNGEKDFYTPANVKELEAYAKPYSNQGFMAVLAWNFFYPDNGIILPEIIDILKIKLDNKEYLELLKTNHKDKYDIIERYYINTTIPDLDGKLPSAIAIPRSMETPKWLIPYIDYESIIDDNVNRFNAIRQSLGIAQSKMKGNRTSYSNILEI